VALGQDDANRPAGAALEAAALRAQAAVLQGELERLERLDWPGWLRNSRVLTDRISELKRQAAVLEIDARRVDAAG
jgi:hypothetical protein